MNIFFKVHIYFIAAFVVGFIAPKKSYSQSRQYTFSYSIPARVYHHYEDTRPPYLTNETYYQNSSVHDSGAFSISNVDMKPGKIISFTIPIESQPYLTIRYTISFKIDSLLPQLQNFSLGFQNKYIATHANIETNSSVSFKNIPYSELTDSTLLVNVNGESCRKNLVSVGYNFTDNEAIMQYYTSTINKFDSLLEDTSSYRFSMSIAPLPIFADVRTNTLTKQSLIIYSSLPVGTIHFSFPSSTHIEMLSIYDILGREISKIEIPAGSNSYVLQSAGYPKGTYFARLGGSSAHFEVN